MMELSKFRRIFRALGEPARCRILLLLREGPLRAGEISRRLCIPKPTLSAHLAILRDAELIGVERRGTQLIYEICRQELQESLARFSGFFHGAADRHGTQPAGSETPVIGLFSQPTIVVPPAPGEAPSEFSFFCNDL